MTEKSVTASRPLANWSDDDLFRALDLDFKRERYATNPLAFAKDVCGHHFSLAVAPLHEEIVRLVFGGLKCPETATPSHFPGSTSSLPVPPKIPAEKFPDPSSSDSTTASSSEPTLVALAAPRGFGKSQLVSFLRPLHAICHDQKHFIVLISNTHAQAKKFLQMLRVEFETNQELKRLYPMLKPNKDKWSDEEIELLRDGKLAHKVIAIGAGAQLRGLRFLQYRPDLLILDDVENEEMVDSEIRRTDLKNWLDHTVLHVNARADVAVIGTVLHEVSLLNRLVRQRDPEDQRAYGHWTRQVFLGLDAQHDRSTWEAYQSTEALRRQREQDPEGFAQEKQNQPVGIGYKSFDKAEFWGESRWYQGEQDLPPDLTIAITVDPAASDREYADETAISVGGWDASGTLWLLDNEHGKYTEPDYLIDRIFYHYTRWEAMRQSHPGWKLYAVGIEKNAFQKFLVNLFRQEATRRTLHPHIIELKGDRDKTRRIRQLVPLFAQDRIKLRQDMVSLESQLKAFPKGQHDDQADAVAYHLQFGSLLPSKSELKPVSDGMTFNEYANLSTDYKRQAYERSLWPESNAMMIPIIQGKN